VRGNQGIVSGPHLGIPSIFMLHGCTQSADDLAVATVAVTRSRKPPKNIG